MANFLDSLKNMSPEQAQFLLSMGSGMLTQPWTDKPQGGAAIGRGMMAGNEAYQNAMVLKRAEEDRQELKGDKARFRAQIEAATRGMPETTRNMIMGFGEVAPGEVARSLLNPSSGSDMGDYGKFAQEYMRLHPNATIAEVDAAFMEWKGKGEQFIQMPVMGPNGEYRGQGPAAFGRAGGEVSPIGGGYTPETTQSIPFPIVDASGRPVAETTGAYSPANQTVTPAAGAPTVATAQLPAADIALANDKYTATSRLLTTLDNYEAEVIKRGAGRSDSMLNIPFFSSAIPLSDDAGSLASAHAAAFNAQQALTKIPGLGNMNAQESMIAQAQVPEASFGKEAILQRIEEMRQTIYALQPIYDQQRRGQMPGLDTLNDVRNGGQATPAQGPRYGKRNTDGAPSRMWPNGNVEIQLPDGRWVPDDGR